jgi:hypothetical protein
VDGAAGALAPGSSGFGGLVGSGVVLGLLCLLGVNAREVLHRHVGDGAGNRSGCKYDRVFS